jgi:capsule polysaccharide export protein KpsE/RkpR
LSEKQPNSEIILAEDLAAEGQVLTGPEGAFRRTHRIDTLRLLWIQRRFLLRVTGCGVIAAILIAFLIPSRFTSTARLMPPDDDGATSGLAMAAAAMTGGSNSAIGGLASDLFGLRSTSDLFVGILTSRTTQDKIIQQFNLRKVYWDRRIEDARKDLESRTNISVDRKSQIITVAVTDRSPRRAAAMAQTYIEELNQLVSELSTSSARRERIFLEGRLQAVSRNLEAAEKGFSQFASKNTAIDVPAQSKAMVESVATLEGQLIAAQSELEGLKQIYSDNNVRVRSVTARVAELRAELQKIGGESDDTLNASGQPSDFMFPSIRELPLLGVTYADLYRKMKVQEAIFETLTREYELAKVQEAKEIPTVKVLDPPNVPDEKSFPPRSLIIFLGTILSFSFAVLGVLGISSWNAIDRHDPGKLLATEIWEQFRARKSSGSDSRSNHPAKGRLLGKFGWQNGPDNGQP